MQSQASTVRMKKRAVIPIGHVVRYHPIPMSTVKQMCGGIQFKLGLAAQSKFLDELQFAISAYASDKQADKTRIGEIRRALKGEMSEHALAAGIWLRDHGGKKQDSHRARIKFNKTVAQGRPKACAKTMLAHSLARVLSEYTVESVSTSRDNGTALTQDGALARLFDAALKVHGETINDPFPYLKKVVDNLSATTKNNPTQNPSQ